MKDLVRLLAVLPPHRLADLIHSRVDVFPTGAPDSLDHLARALVMPAAIAERISALDLPSRQVLVAAARLAADGLPAPTNGWGRRMAGATDAVDRDRLLAALGVSDDAGPARDAALSALRRLAGDALLWPAGGQTLSIPVVLVDDVARQLSYDMFEPPTVADALTAAYLKETIATIAQKLRVPCADPRRSSLQAAIVAHHADPDKVRALVAVAPPDAREFLEMALEAGIVDTDVFDPGGDNRYLIEDEYSEPAQRWLAQRALLVPAIGSLACVPAEVGAALRGARASVFTPTPPTIETTEVSVDAVRGQAQAALTAAATTLGRLVAVLDAQPAALRKSGGMAVRETRRLAKALDATEIDTVFWIDLARAAGLIAHDATGGGHVVCPTAAADEWAGLAVADRLTRVLKSWREMADIPTWWPYPDEGPIAYTSQEDRTAVGLRRGVLRALASAPAGAGCVAATRAIAANVAIPAETVRPLKTLVEAAAWFAPDPVLRYPEADRRIWHTAYEAGLLGVVAHGALTEVGRALVDGDEQTLLAAVTDALPAQRTTARFQADMTVVVTGTPTAALADLLRAIADLESEGHALVYRLSAASVRRAMDEGATADELIGRVTAVAEGALPQPVRFLLAEVGKTHGRVRVVDSACCLRSDDEALLTEIVKARALAPLGLRRIAPTVVVSAKPASATIAGLRSAGYAPAQESASGAPIVEIARGRRAPVPTPRDAATDREHLNRLARALVQRAGTTARTPELDRLGGVRSRQRDRR